MKQFFLLLTGVFIFNISTAQRYAESTLGLDNGVFSALADYGTEDYDGNPYMTELWLPVLVTTINGDQIKSDKSRFDIWQHKLIIEKKDVQIAVNNHQVASFTFTTHDGSADTYVKVGIEDNLRYAKLLTNGSLRVLEVLEKKFNNPTSAESASSYNKKPRPSFSSMNHKYYLSIDDGELIPFKNSKKGIEKAFPENQRSAVKRLLKSKKPDLKNMEELAAFFAELEGELF